MGKRSVVMVCVYLVIINYFNIDRVVFNSKENYLAGIYPYFGAFFLNLGMLLEYVVDRNKSMLMKGLGCVVILLGLVSFTKFADAGYKLQRSGEELTELRSQGGNTVAESYYQGVGRSQIGQSSAAYGMAMSTLMISIGWGGSMISKRK
jgi:hypothetical protein